MADQRSHRPSRPEARELDVLDVRSCALRWLSENSGTYLVADIAREMSREYFGFQKYVNPRVLQRVLESEPRVYRVNRKSAAGGRLRYYTAVNQRT